MSKRVFWIVVLYLVMTSAWAAALLFTGRVDLVASHCGTLLTGGATVAAIAWLLGMVGDRE